ncbi:MAG: hypothetical protein WC371_04305 [Parachlamydiales bacterium]
MLVLDLPDQAVPPPPSSACHFLLPARTFQPENFLLAKIIRIPPKEKPLPYDQLPGSSQEDREKVIKLFTLLGTHSKTSLLFSHFNEANNLGDEIEHIHPLKLLGCLFSCPGMQKHMDNVCCDYFKWKSFLEGHGNHSGFLPNMDREMKKNNLIRHLPDFAKEVNIPQEKLDPYFQNQDWLGLLKFLIYRN